MHTYIHTHTYTHIHTYINTYMQTQLNSVLLKPGWEKGIVMNFYEAILAKDLTIQDTVKIFDQDGDGAVSLGELQTALATAVPDLPENQVASVVWCVRGLFLVFGMRFVWFM